MSGRSGWVPAMAYNSGRTKKAIMNGVLGHLEPEGEDASQLRDQQGGTGPRR